MREFGVFVLFFSGYNSLVYQQDKDARKKFHMIAERRKLLISEKRLTQETQNI